MDSSDVYPLFFDNIIYVDSLWVSSLHTALFTLDVLSLVISGLAVRYGLSNGDLSCNFC